MKCVKFCASLGIAIAFLPVLGQDSQKTISFSFAAGPLSKLVPALAKATGKPLATEGPISKQIVFVSAKDVDPEVLLLKIAQASGGRWEQHDSATWLVLNADQARDDLRDEQKDRAEAIRVALENLQKQSTGVSTEGSGPIREMALDTRGPGGPQTIIMGRPNTSSNKAIIQMLQMIGPANLAQVGADSRVVYALPANRSQKALPQTVVKIVNSLIAELPQRQGPPQVAAKVHLVLSRQLGGNMLTAELKVGDPGGQTLVRDMVSLPIDIKTKPVQLDLKNGATKIALSETAADLAKVFNTPSMTSRASGGTTIAMTSVVVSTGASSGPGPIAASFPGENDTPAPTDKAKQALLNPDKNDPLSYIPGESLQGAADAEGFNIVACIPDSALIPAASDMVDKALTVREVVSGLSKWTMSGDFQDGFLCLKPALPATSRASRLDRTALAAALKAIVAQGYLTLDQKANYVNAQPFASTSDTFEIRHLSAINPGFGGSMQTGLFTGERKMLKFYAQLGLAQRQALIAGRSIIVGSLMPVGRNLVYDMAYNSTNGLNVMAPGGPRQRMFMGGDMSSDPTEVLANGIPEQASITLQTRTTDTAYGITKSGGRVAVNPGAFSMIFTGDPSTGLTPTMTNAANNYGKYQLGKQTQLTFTFQLTPIVSFARTLADDRFDLNSKQLTYQELPDWFLNQANEAQKNMQRMQDRMQQGQGQRANP